MMADDAHYLGGKGKKKNRKKDHNRKTITV